MHFPQNKSFCSPPYSKSTCYCSKVTCIVVICSHIFLLYVCKICLVAFTLEDQNSNLFNLGYQQLPKDCANLCSSEFHFPSDTASSHFVPNI